MHSPSETGSHWTAVDTHTHIHTLHSTPGQEQEGPKCGSPGDLGLEIKTLHKITYIDYAWVSSMPLFFTCRIGRKLLDGKEE